ncbi:MAG: hypothetical protein GX102_13520 [Porphyromonadaceae bacterium]|jgi:hypothetical protein|nr:hypothetical protein [Porphyromonadaceae bacterium]
MKRLLLTRRELEEAIQSSFDENIESITLINGDFLQGDFFELVNQIVEDIIFSVDEDCESHDYYDEDDDSEDLEFEIDDDEYEEDYGEDELI